MSAFGKVAGALSRSYWRVRIWRLGIVDHDYFEALTGRVFSSDFAAIGFYLKHDADAALGLSLSPLIEKDWISRQVPESDASWYATLLKDRRNLESSPLFDAASYAEGRGLATPRGTRDALRHFLRHANPTDPMPVSEQVWGPSPTWDSARQEAIAAARLFATQLHLRRPRTSNSWDRGSERRFRARIKAISAATVAGTRVSVVVATRDRIDRLPEAIKSLQQQTHQNWELIVVDDGSGDGTAEYLESVRALDGRVRVFHQAPLGVSAARNAGMMHARGELIAFLDSDNTWRPEFLELSLRAMQIDARDWVHSAMRLEQDSGQVRYRGMSGTREDLLMAGNFLDLNSVVVSRSLVERVGGFDTEIRRWVDYDWFISLSSHCDPAYLPFIGVDYDDRSSESRITGSEPNSWEDVVTSKHIINWDGLEAAVASRRPGMVSIVVPTYGDWVLTSTAVRCVLVNSGERPVEVIIIDNGSRRHISSILKELFATVAHVQVLRVPRNFNFALATNYGVSKSRGEYVVALNNDTEVGPGWLEPLISPLIHEPTVLGTQPLLLYPDGTVQSAGTVFLEGRALPSHFLAGHSLEDALASTDSDFAAVTAAALCMRATDFIQVRGFDPIFRNGLEDVDLCLRARERHVEGSFRVVQESRVVHHEGKTPDRSRAISVNRQIFQNRWSGRTPASDDWRYAAIGINSDF